MKKLTLFTVAASLCMAASAQQLGEKYVKWPSSGSLPTYIKNWSEDKEMISKW